MAREKRVFVSLGHYDLRAFCSYDKTGDKGAISGDYSFVISSAHSKSFRAPRTGSSDVELKIAGITELALTVDEKGVPQDIYVVHSLADGVSKKQRAEALALDNKAVETVKQYVFEPASFNGKPVPLDVRGSGHLSNSLEFGGDGTGT